MSTRVKFPVVWQVQVCSLDCTTPQAANIRLTLGEDIHSLRPAHTRPLQPLQQGHHSSSYTLPQSTCRHSPPLPPSLLILLHMPTSSQISFPVLHGRNPLPDQHNLLPSHPAPW